MLEVNNITVSYDEMLAIKDVSIKVEESELIAVVGSNGAGKSTLLKAISGVVRPDKGNIKFQGKDITNKYAPDIVKDGIVQVPEGRQLFPNMSVLENLEMGAMMLKSNKKYEEMLELVFDYFPVLKNRQDQLANTLSGGEQQMLAVGRALMSDPKLIMFDEPSLGLAPKLVLTIFDIVKKINSEGKTVILIEQNVQHSLSICDHAYVLENGSVALEGGKDLLENEHVKEAYMGI